MTDALCGPSNPLQQFKQQTQLDRTLQQDRLSSRHAPVQGFRSHDPNVGLLDPEFEAFQAGLPISELPQFTHQPPSFSGSSQAVPSWASDFQRMQISPPPPLQQQQIAHSSAPSASWAQGFQQHVAQSAPRAQTTARSPQAFQQMARYGGMNAYQSSFAQPAYQPSIQTKGKQPATEQFDEAAFARAFDQASDDMMASAQEMDIERTVYHAGASTVDYEVDQEVHVNEVKREAIAAMNDHRRRLSGELGQAIPHSTELYDRLADEHIEEEAALQEEAERVEQQHQNNDDDALAATARELLEKVEHNKTTKFQNSQFLGLMRKLRDREMKVEGDQMVETAASTTTETQQLDTSASAQIPRFDNSEQTPYPLGPLGATRVDTRPPDYNIPHLEQDHDTGRYINPNDGQEVVDYLNQKGGTADPDDIGTSDFSAPPSRDVFYTESQARKENEALAYEIEWSQWDLRNEEPGARTSLASVNSDGYSEYLRNEE